MWDGMGVLVVTNWGVGVCLLPARQNKQTIIVQKCRLSLRLSNIMVGKPLRWQWPWTHNMCMAVCKAMLLNDNPKGG